ncbi:MAG: hypothetical protein ACK55Z_27005, partial [bacterium]
LSVEMDPTKHESSDSSDEHEPGEPMSRFKGASLRTVVEDAAHTSTSIRSFVVLRDDENKLLSPHVPREL